MRKIFEYVEYKPVYIIAGLFLFHIIVACLMSWIAYSPYLSSLHNGQGLWKFSVDSTLYHKEAISLIEVLNEGKWSFWWNSYPGHMQVRWIALIYWIFGGAYPVLFEIVNSFLWVASVIFVYRAGYYLFDGNVKLACISALFLFFPSVILSSTQLLREPFYIFGLCSIVYGWSILQSKESAWKAVLFITLGFYYVVSVRVYVIPMIFGVFLLWTVILLFYKKVERAPALALLFFILFISYGPNLSSLFYTSGEGFATKANVPAAIVFKPPEGYNGEGLKAFLDSRIAWRLSAMRHGFGSVNTTAGSGIDKIVRYQKIEDLFVYLPRAIQIGFLSPFPNHWIASGKQTGRLGRVIAGFETLVLYIVLAGFLWTLFNNMKIIQILAPALIFSGVVVILLGFVVPNIGAIYRMRQGLLVPYFMMGAYGVYFMVLQLKEKYKQGNIIK